MIDVGSTQIIGLLVIALAALLPLITHALAAHRRRRWENHVVSTPGMGPVLTVREWVSAA